MLEEGKASEVSQSQVGSLGGGIWRLHSLGCTWDPLHLEVIRAEAQKTDVILQRRPDPRA